MPSRENFILPLSHDEVVHGKGSLLGKMPGDRWQKFANLRAYLAFMWTHPGKKLLFMGGEFAQEREWSHDRALDWHLLSDASHRGMQNLVRDLNRLYRHVPALHELDCEAAGFEWVEGGDARPERAGLLEARQRGQAARPRRLQFHADRASRVSRRRARRRALGRAPKHGRRRLWRVECRQCRRAPTRRRAPTMVGPSLSRSSFRRWRRLCSSTSALGGSFHEPQPTGRPRRCRPIRSGRRGTPRASTSRFSRPTPTRVEVCLFDRTADGRPLGSGCQS